MLTSSRDQENAIHARQTAAAATKNHGTRPLMPKTPAKTPFRPRQHDENAVSQKKGDGKVKDAVAVLEGKVSKSLSTPAGVPTRAPLGVRTGNTKANVFQTPAKVLTQKPKATSPRLRKAKFHVHETKDEVVEAKPAEREIEYMHPREVPLPDYPDDDLWPHDRIYPQFNADNLTRGWALEFMPVVDEEDFDTRLKHFEAQQVQQPVSIDGTPKTVTAPVKITSSKTASALSSVKGVGSFASATTASSARSKIPLPATRPIAKLNINPRHTAARAASNTTLGYSKGRRVSATAQVSVMKGDDFAPLTPSERNDVLSAMWRHADTSDDDADDFFSPMLSDLDLHDLKDLGAEIPDD